jgi:ATP-binding cassette subfamily B protein
VSTLEASFPGLRRLAPPSRRRRIPFVQQVEWADCGAACLTMILQFHGRALRLEEVRRDLETGRDGLGATAIIAGAARHSMRARCVQLDLVDLAHLPRASILH